MLVLADEIFDGARRDAPILPMMDRANLPAANKLVNVPAREPKNLRDLIDGEQLAESRAGRGVIVCNVGRRIHCRERGERGRRTREQPASLSRGERSRERGIRRKLVQATNVRGIGHRLLSGLDGYVQFAQDAHFGRRATPFARRLRFGYYSAGKRKWPRDWNHIATGDGG